MSQYDELNRRDRAGEEQAERLYERRHEALNRIRRAAATNANEGDALWGLECPLGYILVNTLSSSGDTTWSYVDRPKEALESEGYKAVQISAEDAKRIEDFSDGSEPREKWVRLENGNYTLVPI